MVPIERSEVGGHDNRSENLQHLQRTASTLLAALTRARRIGKNKAIVDQPPLLKLFYKESDSNGRLRISNWIVQRLNDYAVKKAIEL
jgi:hypothetical protein